MTASIIRQKLEEAFKPEVLEIIDHSAGHAGHAGNQGGGHYYVTLVSEQFENLSMVQRHQLIYKTLGEMMKQDIHALGINALTPSENSKGNL